MVDGRTVKNPKVVGIESIDIYFPNRGSINIKGIDLADIDFINETTIAVKTMDGYISLYSNCTYSITSKDCQLMKERYFPE